MRESFTITIRRFDVEKDSKPYLKAYRIPNDDTEYGPMTALKALHHIDRHIEPIAYDYNCRRGTCGRCAMMIDGIPRLACYFELSDSHLLEPLANSPVVRDLVVDKSLYIEAFVKSSEAIHRKEPFKEMKPISGEFWRDTIHPINACRECMCCYADCQANEAIQAGVFLGPGALQQIYLRSIDGIDQSDRIAQAVAGGLFACTQCGMCSLVCPARITCAENIKALMDNARSKGLDKTKSSTTSIQQQESSHSAQRPF